MSAFDPKRLPDMMSVYSYLALSRCSKTVVLKRNFYDDGDIGACCRQSTGPVLDRTRTALNRQVADKW